MEGKKYTHIQTQAIQSREESDSVTRASVLNIVMSTTFITDPDILFSVESIDEINPFL